jgi:UPF0755 protein
MATRRPSKRTSASPKSVPPREPAKKRRPPDDDTSRASSLVRWTLGVLAVGVAAMALLFVFVYPTGDGPGRGARIEFDVVPGEDGPTVAARLHDAGLVGSERIFAWYLRVQGGPTSLVAGRHVLTDDLSPGELLHRLQRRGAAHVKVTIPEGWNRFDIAKRLDALHVCTLRGFLDATESGTLLSSLHVDGGTAEGWLFPATYDLELDSDPEEIVRRMVGELKKRLDTLEQKNESGLLDLQTSLGWGRKQILTLASMVEKEAAVDDERAIIASVFLNRLRDPSFSPHLLQCDPTAGYGCLVGTSPGCNGYTGKVTHEVVADAANPYNTYKHEGLPPGPIANPGARSIEAVLKPAVTHYFYFVAKGNQRHTFSETLSEHNAAVHGDAGAAPP